MGIHSLKYAETCLAIAMAALAVANIADDPALQHTATIIAAITLVGTAYGLWRIRRVFRTLRNTFSEYTQGNLEPRLWLPSERGELYDMLDGINDLVDSIDAFIREARAAMQSAMKEHYYRKIQLTGMSGTFQQGAALFNQGMDTIRDNTLRSIRTAVTELDSVAKLGDEQSKQLFIAASNTSASISTVAAAMEEMNATIAEITQRISQASDLSRTTSEKANASGTALSALLQAVKHIGSITITIQQIADQTNLLALNATIEAARAGEAGKGFAVVASEVKQLAQSTSQATDEITESINAIDTQMKNVVVVIREMIGLIHQSDETSMMISSAMTEQSQAIRDITHSITKASESGNEVTQTAEQVAKQSGRTWEVSQSMHTLCH